MYIYIYFSRLKHIYLLAFLVDTHMKIINKKIGSLLERLNEVEELSRDLEWQKQSNLEENINGLTDRVEFLNRRFDLLLPTTLKQHFQ